jgi:hypothetical protein
VTKNINHIRGEPTLRLFQVNETVYNCVPVPDRKLRFGSFRSYIEGCSFVCRNHIFFSLASITKFTWLDCGFHCALYLECIGFLFRICFQTEMNGILCCAIVYLAGNFTFNFAKHLCCPFTTILLYLKHLCGIYCQAYYIPMHLAQLEEWL